MAELDRELREIFEGIGKDINAVRKALTSSTKSILDNNTKIKVGTALKKRLIAEEEAKRKLLKDNNELTDEQNQQIDENIRNIQQHSEATSKASKGQISFSSVAMKAVKALTSLLIGAVKIGANFGKTSSNIKTFNDAVEAGFDEIPYLGAALKKLAPEIDDNVQLFSGLAQSGASFGSSITTLRMAAADAGMPLVQFQELIENNTSTLARLFGSVQQGVPQFVGLGKALRRFTETELAQFGLTMDDTNEFLTTFAELERARGRAGQMTQQSLLQGTQEYTKNLVLLSKLTGESVKDLDARNRQLAADGVFQAKLAQMDEKQAERVRQALNLLPEGAEQAAKEIIGLGAPVSDAARGLQVLSGGQFGDTLRALMEGTETDLLEVSNVFKQMGTDIINSGDAAASAALAGNPMFAEVLNIATSLAGVSADRESVEAEMIASQQDNIVAAVNMTSALDRNTVELQKLGTTLLEGEIFGRDSRLGPALRDFTMGGENINDEYVANSTKFTATLSDQLRKFYGMLPNMQDFGNTDIDPSGFVGAGVSADQGTPGFMDFGKGTPAVLHKSEMVLPERNVGELSKMVAENIKKMFSIEPEVNTTNNAGDTVNNTNMDMSTLNANTTELIELNKKVANHLNTLITIGAMTEKNTKNFNNNLANMSGTLV